MISKRTGVLVATALLALVPAAPAVAAVPEATVHAVGGPTAVDDSYIVVLADSAAATDAVHATDAGTATDAATVSAVDRTARSLADRYRGDVARVYRHALRGFEVHLSPRQARRLAADPRVASVTQNHTITAADIQTPVPSWGLDRVDQRSQPLDDTYAYPDVAPIVQAYIIDTGIMMSHDEFAGRVRPGPDTVDNDDDPADCRGHGTHVAGTAGGTTYGVAKNVELVAVRVLDCNGAGNASTVIAGIDWVTADHAPGAPAVANMSLNTRGYAPVDQAVAQSIADGITYVVSAGNDSTDACTNSPARVTEVITVAATGADDARAPYSNVGGCVDIFAPGTDIVSAGTDSDSAARPASGTSMAAPHVTGAAALILAEHPDYTPAQVTAALLADATPGVVTDPGGSPNRLLHVDDTTPAHDFTLSAGPAGATVAPGGTVTTTVSASVTAGAAQSVDLSVVGLPRGATATFAPAGIDSAGSTTLTITTAAVTGAGSYPVLILGTGEHATRTASFTLTVSALSGCVGIDDIDRPLPLGTAVDVLIEITGCAGNAAANSTIELRIPHSAIVDLQVELFAPDGTRYFLLVRTGHLASPDVDHTFTYDLSDKVANGTWRLHLRDAGPVGAGSFDSWTLNLAGADLPVPVCGGEATTDVPIGRRAIVESPITVAGCDLASGNSAWVDVRVVHPWSRDLSFDLVASDGQVFPLQGVNGMGLPDMFRTFVVSWSGKPANGTWKLRVQDHDSSVPGPAYIDGWRLTLRP
ncbi:subtilisin family serine protease [Micromonospora sp. Llam0]|uniref:S8 family peptidase n=1 Tax=Micromonospora sp. Llam0 TaxID=2485143 RepID=UPI000F4A26C9|nr:S8 family peptidase [Micromonospora sp. Llam0]ROO51187.1 subtilisin family serine protease [Micromonospora sp. Llam0]